MAGIKCLSGNLNIHVISELAYVDSLSNLSWDFIDSWYDEWFSIETWTFWVHCYETLDLISVYFSRPPLIQLWLWRWKSMLPIQPSLTPSWGKNYLLPLCGVEVKAPHQASTDATLAGRGRRALFLFPTPLTWWGWWWWSWWWWWWCWWWCCCWWGGHINSGWSPDSSLGLLWYHLNRMYLDATGWE